MADLHPNHGRYCITDHELCCPKVWRSWNGRFKVRYLVFSFCSLLTIEAFHRSLRPLIVALVPGQQRSLDKLKAMRVQLSNEVAAVINDFGPSLYEDFDKASIHKNSSIR